MFGDVGRETHRHEPAPVRSGRQCACPKQANEEIDAAPAVPGFAELERCNVLVNNAGITLSGSIEDTSEDNWRQQMTTNLDSVYYGCQEALPLMKAANEPGSIINIASSFAVRPTGSYLAYCTSKGAVTTMTKTIALHCAAKGYPIRANVIHPGGTETSMLDRTFAQSKLPRDQMYAMFEKLHPMGRYGKPDEVAQACLWLACEESSFTTGSEIMVDGGMSIRT